MREEVRYNFRDSKEVHKDLWLEWKQETGGIAVANLTKNRIETWVVIGVYEGRPTRAAFLMSLQSVEWPTEDLLQVVLVIPGRGLEIIAHTRPQYREFLLLQGIPTMDAR